MSSAVIFGGCGFIGLYFAEEILNLNLYKNIYLIDIKEPENNFCKLQYEKILKSGRVKFFRKDIRENLHDIPIGESVDIILNFAAVHREPGHLDFEYSETNVKGAENICSFADNFKCKNIIFTSSIAVYGDGEHEKNENSTPKPTSPYGKSKLDSEKIHIIWQNADKLNRVLSICRSGVVFGAGEKGNVTRLVKIIKKKLFFYMGNQNLKKGGIYIKELISILIWVNQNQLSKKIPNLGLYNAAIVPCPTLENYATNISKKFNFSEKFFSIPNILVNVLLFISFLYTKISKKNNALNYVRVKKLFRSNYISSQYLINNNYPFKYNLSSSLDDWKKIHPSDWG